jgi:chromosome segregation ATPase
VIQLKAQALQVADNAKSALDEAQLRAQMLLQELAELRAAVTERDTRLAQATSNQAVLADQVKGLQADWQASRQREGQAQAELAELNAAQAEAIASARKRYDGLSKQLLQETAQQRQAAQVEIGRLASQMKFAEKREATQLGRIAQLEADLLEVRAQRDKAAGEVSALKYVNTALKTQVDEFLQSRTQQSPDPAPKLARGRRRASGKGSMA